MPTIEIPGRAGGRQNDRQNGFGWHTLWVWLSKGTAIDFPSLGRWPSY
jgi:hypothetical protein